MAEINWYAREARIRPEAVALAPLGYYGCGSDYPPVKARRDYSEGSKAVAEPLLPSHIFCRVALSTSKSRVLANYALERGERYISQPRSLASSELL